MPYAAIAATKPTCGLICKHKNEIGCEIAAYPLTLLSSAIYAVREALHYIREGKMPEGILDFIELQSIVGFFEYDETLKRFAGKK